jgi:hypothetical protein
MQLPLVWEQERDSISVSLEAFSEDFASAVKELNPGSFVVALKGYKNYVL